MPGNPNNVDTAKTTPASFEEEVNTVVKTMEKNNDGIWEFPEDVKDTIPENIKVAAIAIKRHRDTQGALTKSQQSKKALEAQNEALVAVLKEQAGNNLNISAEEQEELDDLMVTDPQAWRAKLNTYEQRATEQLADKINQTSVAAEQASINEGRKLTLEQFNLDHGTEITEDVLNFDVPPRFVKKLEAGEITYEEYLNEVNTYLTAPKKAKDEPVIEQPNLSSVGGGSTASKQSANKDAIESYKDVIF